MLGEQTYPQNPGADHRSEKFAPRWRLSTRSERANSEQDQDCSVCHFIHRRRSASLVCEAVRARQASR